MKLGGLISVLIDSEARIDERDDAAMDLGEYDDDRALSALLMVGSDDSVDEIVLESCGESLGEIWIKRDFFPKEQYLQLMKDGQLGVRNALSYYKPEWIEIYGLK